MVVLKSAQVDVTMKRSKFPISWIPIAAFLIPAVMLCIVYAINGIVPFGDQTLLISDSGGQYIRFWNHFREIMFGERDALYTFSKTLGGSMAGLYAYYLASPLNIIFLFFSEEQLPLAMNLLILLKLSLSGLTFALFTEKTKKMGVKTLLFSTAYALCAYNIGYCWNLMWLDGVIMLPIVALGIHYISEGRKPWVYIFSLAAAIISSYYIGFMLCIFSLFYYIYLIALKNRSIKTVSAKNNVSFALSSLCAGAMSAAILVPGLLSMRGGKRAPMQNSFERSLHYYIDLIASRFFPEKTVDYDKVISIAVPVMAAIAAMCIAAAVFVAFTKRISIRTKRVAGIVCLAVIGGFLITKESFAFTLVKLFTGTTTVYQVINGYPNVFTGIAVMLSAGIYFVCKGITRRERIISALFLSIMMLSFSFESFNIIWHGFTKNYLINFRYSFIFSFLILLLAMRAAENFRSVSIKRLALCTAVIAVVIVFGAVSNVAFFGVKQIIFCSLAVVIFAAGIYMLHHGRPNKKIIIAVIAAISLLHAADLCYNAHSSIKSMITTYDITMAEYEQEISRISDDVESIPNDDGFFRVRKDYAINKNDPIMAGYNGLSHFSSTDKTDVVAFMEDIGAATYDNIWASAEGDFTRAADSLLGVKYFAASGEYLDYMPTDSENIYENPYALPIGFVADSSVLQPVSLTDCTFEYQNNVFGSLSEGEEIFTPIDIQWITPEAEENNASDGMRYEFTFRTVSEGPVYLHIEDDLRSMEKATVYVNDARTFRYDDARGNSVILCGSFASGEEVRVLIEAKIKLFDTDCIKVYHENSEVLQEYHKTLTSRPCRTECETDSHIITSVSVNQDEACLVYTIPYEEDWRITVDGERVKPSKVLDIFMAVPLEQGEHTVEMRYVPAGLTAGILISLIALVSVGGAILYDRKKHIFG